MGRMLIAHGAHEVETEPRPVLDDHGQPVILVNDLDRPLHLQDGTVLEPGEQAPLIRRDLERVHWLHWRNDDGTDEVQELAPSDWQAAIDEHWQEEPPPDSA